MGNCTGIIFGHVTSSVDGSPIAGVRVSLNWIQKEGGAALKVGGNEDLNQFVPACNTTEAGEYVILFFGRRKRCLARRRRPLLCVSTTMARATRRTGMEGWMSI